MEVVDAQVHIWGPSTPSFPWPPDGNPPHRTTPFTGDDLVEEMDAAGVSRAIVVPPTFAGGHNHVALEAARAYPDRIAVMGVLDLLSDSSRELIPTWRDTPGMLGIRVNFRKKVPNALLAGGQLDWLLEGAQAAQIPISFLAQHRDLPLIADVATRYPSLKLGLDHLGLTEGKGTGDEAFADFDEVIKLSALSNVTVKVSALPAYAADQYPYRGLHQYVRRVYDAFGPERMMWGTDLTRLPCTYSESVTMFTEEMDWLTPDDKEWVMGRSLSTWAGWPRSES